MSKTPEQDRKRINATLFQLRRNMCGEDANVLIDMLGEDKAFTFMNAFGGQEGCLVPLEPRPDHRWAEILGLDGLAALCDAWGGVRISIPRAAHANSRKYHIARALLENELPRLEIARRLQVTTRYVRQVAADMRADGIDVPVGDPRGPEWSKRKSPAKHGA